MVRAAAGQLLAQQSSGLRDNISNRREGLDGCDTKADAKLHFDRGDEGHEVKESQLGTSLRLVSIPRTIDSSPSRSRSVRENIARISSSVMSLHRV
jgi:hypothetical protein